MKKDEIILVIFCIIGMLLFIAVYGEPSMLDNFMAAE